VDVYVISRSIGTVRLDQTIRESHDSTLRVTDNPVESGAVIADHAVLEPRKLMVQGKMVDWLAAGVNVAPADGIFPRVSPDFLNVIPMPALVQTFTDETSYQAARLLSPASSYTGAITSALGLARPLAPWLPDFTPIDTLDMSSGTKRVEQVFDNLRTVQKSGEAVDIITGSQHYENMLLVAVTMLQQYDGSAEISITAQEIFIVETQTVNGITVSGGPGSAGSNKSGRAGAQSLSTKNKGNVQTPEASEATKKTALRALANSMLGQS